MNKFASAFARVSLALALVLTIFTVAARVSHATDFDVAVASGAPTDSAADFTRISGTSGTPTGNLYLRDLVVSNYLGASVQNVGIYDTCTSSTTATLRMVVVVAASTTVHLSNFPASTFQLSDPCFTKTDANSTVNLTGLYQ